MNRTRLARAGLATLACVALMAGCSSSGAADEGATATQSSTTAGTDSGSSDSAQDAPLPSVAADFGETPTFDFPDAGPSGQLQVEVLKQGDGPKVKSGMPVVADYAGVVWGETEPFDSSFSRGAPALFSLQNVVAGWSKGIPGHTVGSRLLISIPPELGYGKQGNPAAGISGEDTIVFVVDLIDTFGPNQTGEADATAVTPTDDLPVHVEGDLGEPASISVPDGAEVPTKPKATVIAEGSGKPVESGQTVVIAYAMSSWDGTTAQTTWATGDGEATGPVTAPVGRGGIADHLIDVPVGSRVLVLVPQTQQAPPAAFVMDILGAA